LEKSRREAPSFLQAGQFVIWRAKAQAREAEKVCSPLNFNHFSRSTAIVCLVKAAALERSDQCGEGGVVEKLPSI
jgi:hypothetical protein